MTREAGGIEPPGTASTTGGVIALSGHLIELDDASSIVSACSSQYRARRPGISLATRRATHPAVRERASSSPDSVTFPPCVIRLMIDSRSAWSFDGERNDCIATRREFERDVIGKPKGHSFRAKQVSEPRHAEGNHKAHAHQSKPEHRTESRLSHQGHGAGRPAKLTGGFLVGLPFEMAKAGAPPCIFGKLPAPGESPGSGRLGECLPEGREAGDNARVAAPSPDSDRPWPRLAKWHSRNRLREVLTRALSRQIRRATAHNHPSTDSSQQTESAFCASKKKVA